MNEGLQADPKKLIICMSCLHTEIKYLILSKMADMHEYDIAFEQYHITFIITNIHNAML